MAASSPWLGTNTSTRRARARTSSLPAGQASWVSRETIGRRASGREVPDERGGGPEGHGSDVDYRCAVLLLVGPPRWDVPGARRHLEATLRLRPVPPAAVPVVLADHPVPYRRTVDWGDA